MSEKHRLQKLAGLVTESQYKDIENEGRVDSFSDDWVQRAMRANRHKIPDIKNWNATQKKIARGAANWKPTKKGIRVQQLEDKYDELEWELKDLKSRRRQLDIDMELDAGEMGDKWTDDDANRYGTEMNELDNNIEKIEAMMNKIKTKLISLGIW